MWEVNLFAILFYFRVKRYHIELKRNKKSLECEWLDLWITDSKSVLEELKEREDSEKERETKKYIF
jgi:hypothetical protein